MAFQALGHDLVRSLSNSSAVLATGLPVIFGLSLWQGTQVMWLRLSETPLVLELVRLAGASFGAFCDGAMNVYCWWCLLGCKFDPGLRPSFFWQRGLVWPMFSSATCSCDCEETGGVYCRGEEADEPDTVCELFWGDPERRFEGRSWSTSSCVPLEKNTWKTSSQPCSWFSIYQALSMKETAVPRI